MAYDEEHWQGRVHSIDTVPVRRFQRRRRARNTFFLLSLFLLNMTLATPKKL
jgi:hypothetical protein